MLENTFSISVESTGRCSVVSVVGEVDVATAPDLRHRLNEPIDDGSPLLVVDLLGVTFIDSTGLGALIEALKHAQSNDATMRIVVSEPRILKVFKITGLTEVFEIRASREEAIAG